MQPTTTCFTFRTARQVPRLGVMLVGWGGNNGSTLTAAVLANRLRLTWPTRTGRKVGALAARRTPRGEQNGGGVEVWAWLVGLASLCELDLPSPLNILLCLPHPPPPGGKLLWLVDSGGHRELGSG